MRLLRGPSSQQGKDPRSQQGKGYWAQQGKDPQPQQASGQPGPSSEEGSVLLLIIGLCLVLLLVASTVVAVSSIYLERQRLQALADQAAWSSAQQVRGISIQGQQAYFLLSSEQVYQSTQAFLVESGAGGDFQELSLDAGSGVLGSNTVKVVLSARVQPPILSVVLPDGVRVQVSGQARVRASQVEP